MQATPSNISSMGHGLRQYDIMIPKVDEIEKVIIEMQSQKDKVMDISREMIRLSGKSITMMHTGKMDSAKKMLDDLSSLAKKLKSVDSGFEYNSQQAYQEYAEAHSLYFMLHHHRIPSSKEIGVDGISYLLGLLDVMGELKREIFEALRKGEVNKAENYYGFMVEIHDSLLPLRFSSSLIPDFRRKQDVGRIQLESVSSELLSFGKRSRQRK